MTKFPLMRIVGAALVLGFAALLALTPQTPERARAQQAPDPLAPLTDDSLKNMLNGLGYDSVKENKTQTGSSYDLSISEGTWTFGLTASLSSDKTNLWLTSLLATVPADGNVPAARLLAFLSAVNDSSGTYVEYDKGLNGLYAASLLPNQGITAKKLRSQIAMMTSFIQTTAPLWTTNWNDPIPAANPAPAAKSAHGPHAKGQLPVKKKD